MAVEGIQASALQATQAPVESVPNGQSPEETTTPESPKEDALSPKFAQLARQQKRLREEQRRIEDDRKAVEAQRKEIDQAKSWKQRLTEDPYGVMLESGLTADQVAALMLNQPDIGSQKFTLQEQKIKALEDKIESLTKGSQDQITQQRESAKKQILHDVRTTVEADDTFEALKVHGDAAYEAVVDLIEQTFDKEGYVMDTDKAIQQVEDYLIEQALTSARMKKVQSKLNPPAPVEAPQTPDKKQPLVQKQTPQTLSNRMVQSAGNGMLTSAQKRANAIAVAEGRPKPY